MSEKVQGKLFTSEGLHEYLHALFEGATSISTKKGKKGVPRLKKGIIFVGLQITGKKNKIHD